MTPATRRTSKPTADESTGTEDAAAVAVTEPSSKDVRDQLDDFIRTYREGNHQANPELVYYVDALQSFRTTVFGEALP